MSFIADFITWVNGFVGNFGLTVVILVVAAQILLIPFKIFSHKNKKAKAACEPEIREIRKKYNANQLGVSMDDDPNMDPAIKKMSHDERDEAMANEIDAVYKAHGYKLWTGWIPMAVQLLVLILLWQGIAAACPEGFFKFTVRDIGADASINYTWNIILLAASPALALLSGLFTLLSSIIKTKRQNIPLKPVVIAGVISLVISMALAIWIATSVTTAIAIALATLQAWSIIDGWIEKATSREPAEQA